MHVGTGTGGSGGTGGISGTGTWWTAVSALISKYRLLFSTSLSSAYGPGTWMQPLLSSSEVLEFSIDKCLRC